jgi:hypothetical protein
MSVFAKNNWEHWPAKRYGYRIDAASSTGDGKVSRKLQVGLESETFEIWAAECNEF